MIIPLVLTVLVSGSQAGSDCSLGACYAPGGDLLLGRAALQLSASSTCGLSGSEVYCTPYQQRRMKCCPCDSQNPMSDLAHTIQDVVSTAGPERWWQSRNGVSPVTLQLDLKDLFLLDGVFLSFKGPRPQALVVERSLDHGRTWQPYVYMATDCATAFPGVSTSTPLTLHETYCYTLPNAGADLYQDHQIQFRPLEQYKYVPVSKGQKLEEVAGVTALRVRLTQLGEVPQIPGRALSRFYALKEMRVIGRCMCHGHANKCLPSTYSNAFSSSIQVHPQCECLHHTAGRNCERCEDLYNDLPWRAAEENNPHMCRRCECNNHAQSCWFDPVIFESSGRLSGGVCEGCMHHTMGPNCDQCVPGYHPNPQSRMDRPDACIRCQCSAVGAVSDQCHPLTGQCPCHPHFHGLSCDRCSGGFWKPAGSHRCLPCACDPTGSQSHSCDQQTGQCQCRAGLGGKTCSQCADRMFGDPVRGCRSCSCSPEGTDGCDKQTGACVCRPGVTGARCDACSRTRDRCHSFPSCKTCPACFFTLDTQSQNLSLALSRVSLPPVTDPTNYGPRIHALESSLNRIRNSISLSPDVVSQVDKAFTSLWKLRDEVNEIKNECLPVEKKVGLDKELEKLQDLLNTLNLDFKKKSDNLLNTTTPIDSGAFTAIKKAYNESIDTAKNINATKDVVQKSSYLRNQSDELLQQVQPVNTENLDQLNRSMTSHPDLTPLAKLVCDSARSEPCTPLTCGGQDLCPPDGSPPCGGPDCEGALPLGNKALSDAKEVQEQLDVLSQKITDVAEKLQKTQESTNVVRQSAEKLTNRIKEARDVLEKDLTDAQDVVKELKDFLSDPSSNLTHIQQVSDWVLKAKLPLSLAALKRRLEELKNLSSSLPDSTDVLKKAQPQLEAATKLLQQAQQARETAQGVKADVDGLVSGLGSVEQSLSDLKDQLQTNLDQLNSLHNNINKAQEKLSPAEKALDDVATLLTPIKPQLEELKTLLESGGQQAQGAQDKADQAEDQATTTDEDMSALEKQLKTLKAEAASRGPEEEAAEFSKRLAKLQQDAWVLANTTDSMHTVLEGKADSIRLLQDEILQKSTRLQGLDDKLKDLVAQLREKGKYLQSC